MELRQQEKLLIHHNQVELYKERSETLQAEVQKEKNDRAVAMIDRLNGIKTCEIVVHIDTCGR